MRRVINQATPFLNKPYIFVGEIKGVWEQKKYTLHGAENRIALILVLWPSCFLMFQTLRRLKDK